MSSALDLFSIEELLKRKEYHLKKLKEINELLILKDEEQQSKSCLTIPNQKNVKIKIKIIPKNSLI
jgi:hypothetical protein